MNVAPYPRTGLDLFSGYGGLDLAVARAVPGYRSIAHVEREGFAAAILAARMADGSLPSAPIWSDVRTFDACAWRGRVDLVLGGFPCQDISTAGKRAGIEGGDRSVLWFEMLRIIRDVRPRYVFVENVAAIVVRGLETVLAGLAALGFDAEWTLVRASDVGAPHRRERLFLLARNALAHGHGHGLAIERVELSEDANAQSGRDSNGCDGEGLFGNPHLAGLEGRGLLGSGYSDERTSWPPGPSDADGWRRFLMHHPANAPTARRIDALPAALQATLRADAELEIRGEPHGASERLDRLRAALAIQSYRIDQLRALGNGVVPDQGAQAWRILWERLVK